MSLTIQDIDTIVVGEHTYPKNECKCCGNRITIAKPMCNQIYCSHACLKMYKAGSVTVGKLVVKKFDDKYALRNIIREAAQDGHEYVTVSFNN
jgi:hypothetical protein